jgi:hypothetical protein
LIYKGVTVPASYASAYTDADMVIFVTSRPVTSGVLAWYFFFKLGQHIGKF